MSTPDASLSAAERAALAELEAAAAAADPGLAAFLRGGASRRLRSDLRLLQTALAKATRAVIGIRWWGVPVTVAGMVLMVLGIPVAMVLSLFGAVVAGVGLAVLAQMAREHFARHAAGGPGTAG